MSVEKLLIVFLCGFLVLVFEMKNDFSQISHLGCQKTQKSKLKHKQKRSRTETSWVVLMDLFNIISFLFIGELIKKPQRVRAKINFDSEIIILKKGILKISVIEF